MGTKPSLGVQVKGPSKKSEVITQHGSRTGFATVASDPCGHHASLQQESLHSSLMARDHETRPVRSFPNSIWLGVLTTATDAGWLSNKLLERELSLMRTLRKWTLNLKETAMHSLPRERGSSRQALEDCRLTTAYLRHFHPSNKIPLLWTRRLSCTTLQPGKTPAAPTQPATLP